MTATLLQFVQEAADNLSLGQPSSVISNADETARVLLALSNRVGRDLSATGENGGFVELQRLYTITTVASQEEYALPSDLGALVDMTAWDRSSTIPMIGALSPQEWQEIKSGSLGSGLASRRFRILRSGSSTSKTIRIDPIPSANGDTLVIEYVSSHWCQDSGATTTRAAWAADTDTFLLHRDLMLTGMIFRYRMTKGRDASSAYDDHQRVLNRELARNRPGRAANLAYRRSLALGDWRNLPETGIVGPT